MPHVWEMVLGDEVEKIRQFVKRIVQEMEARKRAFLKHAVSSLSAYREAVDPDLPAIVIMIEQLKPLLEQYPEMDALINEIAGSGQAFGIYLIFTTNAGASVSYKITQKVGKRELRRDRRFGQGYQRTAVPGTGTDARQSAGCIPGGCLCG